MLTMLLLHMLLESDLICVVVVIAAYASVSI